MAIERMSDGQLHRRLKALMRETWARTRARFADVRAAVAEMGERIERSVRIQNLLHVLEERGRHDLIACAYNGVRFA